MMLKRRILSLIMLAVMCLAFVLPVRAAAENITVEDKADILAQLSILSGSGTDYDLNGYLKRYQAAIFLVKALGKTELVEANKEQYKVTGFTDVAPSAKYAPYVGYCASQKYISGYSNGKYSPEDVISEKQFLSILLISLGYKSGTDYDMNTIYNLAFDVGLVLDSSYRNKTGDNINYKRADAVEVLYNFLRTSKKGSEETIIEELIAEGTVERDTALYAGLLDEADNVVTSIVTVTPVEQGKVFLKLNESIGKLTNSDISIYETSDTTKKLSAELESQTGDTAVIKTSSQVSDRNYTFEIIKATDLEGNVTNNIKATFSGFRTNRNQSDFLRVSKVDAVNNKRINVFFTQPINVNAEIPSQYDIYDGDSLFVTGGFQNLTVKRLENSYDGISIRLNSSSFTGGKSYTLKVSGKFTGLYGTKINEGSDDSVSFIANANSGSNDIASSDTLAIYSVNAIDSKTIEVLFNKEIDPFYAKQYLNYMVTASGNVSITVNKAAMIEEGEYKGRGVRLGLASPLDSKKNYELYINFLTDVSKKDQFSEGKYTFSGEYPVKSDLVLLDTVAYNNRTVVAVFDKPLDSATVTNLSYYTIIGVSHAGYSCNPVKVSYEPQDDYYAVKLFLPADKPLQEDKTYKLRVPRTMQYNLGSTSSRDMEYTFRGNSEEYPKPNISQALIVGEDAIKLTFDTEISQETPNISPVNYSILYREDGNLVSKVPFSVIYIDPYTLIVKCDNLSYETPYQLKYEVLKDLAGISQKTASEGQNIINVSLGRR
jgi:hypothetical protein